MSNNQEQWRNKKTGTIYQSVEFLGNNLAEANTGKSIYLVKESNLERVEPMADTQELEEKEYVTINMLGVIDMPQVQFETNQIQYADESSMLPVYIMIVALFGCGMVLGGILL